MGGDIEHRVDDACRCARAGDNPMVDVLSPNRLPSLRRKFNSSSNPVRPIRVKLCLSRIEKSDLAAIAGGITDEHYCWLCGLGTSFLGRFFVQLLTRNYIWNIMVLHGKYWIKSNQKKKRLMSEFLC